MSETDVWPRRLARVLLFIAGFTALTITAERNEGLWVEGDALDFALLGFAVACAWVWWRL